MFQYGERVKSSLMTPHMWEIPLTFVAYDANTGIATVLMENRKTYLPIHCIERFKTPEEIEDELFEKRLEEARKKRRELEELSKPKPQIEKERYNAFDKYR